MRPEDLGIGKLFERVRDAVIVADAETQQIILWNPAATNIFGYSLYEALDLRVEALVPEHFKAKHRAGMSRYAQTGHGAYIDSQRLLDLPGLTKDGEEIRIELSLNPIEPPAEGGGRFVLAIIRDITERRRGEEALRDAEALFRSVFDNASIGMAVTAPDARLLRVNPAMCEILGYSEDELLGTEFRDITHPEDLDVSTEYFHQAIEGEIDEYSLEKRYIGAGDRVVWISLNTSLVRDAEGKPLYFVDHIQDITRRKQAEERLRASEAELRAVFGAMNDVIFVFDAEGRYLKVAPTHPSLLYRPAEEVAGKTLHEVLPREQADAILGGIRRVIETRQRATVEYGLQIDGRQTWFAMTISLMLEDSVVAVARDITDRKLSETRLREAETRYRTIVENIPAATYIQPAGGTPNLTYISPQIERILGYPREELLGDAGRNWIELLHPDDRERVRAEDERTNATGDPFREEYRQLTKDGRYVWIREESVLVRGEMDEPLYWQGFLWDITQRKLAEEEIRHLNETLERRVAERTQQLAEREVRLRKLLGKLVVAQEEERRRVAYEVHDGLAQMIVGVQQHMQAFAKQHPPDSARAKESLDWNLQLIQQTVEEARRVIAGLRPTALDDFGLAAALRLQVETLRSEGWEITYDESLGDERLSATLETAFYRVAQEALTNVRKHADTTRVRLSLGRLGQEIRLRVRDRGRGFSKTEMVSGGGPGERVGISGMEERVALLGGTFRVMSRPGAGTLLVARVPLAGSGEDVSNG